MLLGLRRHTLALLLLQAPEEPSDTVRVRLAPPKDVSTVLQIKALVGNRGSGVFHVFEMEQKLPKFAMYVPRPLDQAHNQRPDSSVVFQVCRAPFHSRRKNRPSKQALTAPVRL